MRRSRWLPRTARRRAPSEHAQPSEPEQTDGAQVQQRIAAEEARPPAPAAPPRRPPSRRPSVAQHRVDALRHVRGIRPVVRIAPEREQRQQQHDAGHFGSHQRTILPASPPTVGVSVAAPTRREWSRRRDGGEPITILTLSVRALMPKCVQPQPTSPKVGRCHGAGARIGECVAQHAVDEERPPITAR